MTLNQKWIVWFTMSYVIQCKKCGFTYIGESVNLRHKMSAHRFSCSSLNNVCQEVSRHLCECGMGFHICPLFKMKQEGKIARLVMEDKLVKLLKPDLNRDKRNLLHLLWIRFLQLWYYFRPSFINCMFVVIIYL